jgi:two-component system nitrogen regulation response regulator NtrX
MSSKKPRDLCERTFLFSRDIVAFCLALSQRSGAYRQIAGQLLRAGTSVGANAEEAKAAYTRREFACKNSLVLREARESAEREHILKALEESKWNVSGAARVLGMERTNLHKRIRALGLNREK